MRKSFTRPEVDEHRIPSIMKLKWGLDLCKEGYVPMAKTLLRSATKLFDKKTALIDLIVTLSIADVITSRNSPVSYDFIAFIGGLTPDEVEASVKRLIKSNYLQIEQIEKFRFIPEFTGLLDKVEEINDAWDLNYTNEFSPPRE